MILIVSCMMVDCHNGNHNYLSSASTIQFDSSWARKMPMFSSASEWAPISHLRAAGAWKKNCTRSDIIDWLVLPPWNGSPQLGGGEHEALGHAGAEYVPFPFPIETSEFSSFPIPLIFERVGWSLVRCHFIVLLFVTRNEWEIVLGFYLTGNETRTGSSV